MYVEDDMGLQLSGPPAKNDIMYAEEQMSNLKDQVRELRDENGRLYKLLSERDYEVRQVRKKIEKERALLTGSAGGVASEAAATKIVELSKKNRELTAEVESGRTKMTQLTRKVQDLEKQLKAAVAQARASARDEKASPRQVSLSLEEERDSEADVRAMKEKLTQTTSKLLETKNEVSMLKQELKVANKVLEKEVGEGVNIQALLKDSNGFRGRAQQILNLQKKVSELKSQLGMQTTRSGSGLSLEEQFMGTTTRATNYNDKNRDRIRQLERDRKEASEAVPCTTVRRPSASALSVALADQDKTVEDESSHLNSWAEDNKMTLNGGKSLLLQICFSRSVPIPPTITLGGQPVPSVDCAKGLGFLIDKDLTFNEQVNSMISNASRRLHYLRLLTKQGTSVTDLIQIYLALVRPVLEYGHVLLVGCSKEQELAIERVQRRALRIISLGGRRSVPDLPTLKSRREDAAVHLFQRMLQENHPLHDLVPPSRSGATGRTLRNSSTISKAQAEKAALEADYSKLKDRCDASKARNKVLANEVKSLKDQLAVLLDKGKNDDELITALMIITKNMQDQNIVDQLKAIVAQKEGQVKALEEEIRGIRNGGHAGGHVSPVRCPPSRSTPSDLHGNRPPSAHHGLGSSMSSHSHGNDIRPTSSEAFYLNTQNQNGRGSRNGVTSPARSGSAQAIRGATVIRPATDSELKVKDIEIQLQEQRTVCQAAQVERDKLIELVQVLHNRLDEAEQKATEADSQLSQHRQRNVQLEKQLGKAKLENKGSPKKGRSTVRDSVGQGDFKPGLEDLEEMEVQLSIQRDENEALKAALQSTLKAKEEDLKFYRTIMDQTKQIFLQGLREHRQRGTTS
ncbi:Coiled-coil domain-containing protein 13 [Branchiostoma belcheri]|nr:Coiled-coil domain-containing protein 13 [Branchiostoma belcheri]